MSSKKTEQKFSFLDLFKGGIPNPAGYPIPRGGASSSAKFSKTHRAISEKPAHPNKNK